MIGVIIKFFTKKELVLFHKHRQTIPLVKNPQNQKEFVFFEITKVWQIVPFKSTNKNKHRIMYMVLCLLNPRYIISMNWTSSWDSLYKVWTKSHPKSKFIVVQHGSYVGGVVTDIAHRYTKCDIFLTWGDYFTQMFRRYNKGKKVEIVTFGNSIYNDIDRAKIEPKNIQTGKILLIPSPITYEHLPHYESLNEKLKEFGYSVYFKPHNYQKRAKYATLDKIEILSENLYAILNKNDFELIISDKSTALLDAIFFKNRVLFFSPPGEIPEYDNNFYSSNLINLFSVFKGVLQPEDISTLVDFEKQEKMLESMCYPGNNSLTTLSQEPF